MTPGDREALEALQRRLGHAEAIADLIAQPIEATVGTALRGIALMLSDIGDTLDQILLDAKRDAS
ncbi:hypothetical protein [Sphingomonas sp. Leaf226]|uniref:hypothetical protein n=1 Tax=Sphingomonas sp. Leaf226 TaxID=1735691 RepID=UPI0006F391E5|nr:hypothetical protein [Sphingomonas sp. Leaf226]KQM99426.1 hypothetical protein ASE77_00050 [Sphingomonas sp. Leaf226]